MAIGDLEPAEPVHAGEFDAAIEVIVRRLDAPLHGAGIGQPAQGPRLELCRARFLRTLQRLLMLLKQSLMLPRGK